MLAVQPDVYLAFAAFLATTGTFCALVSLVFAVFGNYPPWAAWCGVTGGVAFFLSTFRLLLTVSVAAATGQVRQQIRHRPVLANVV